MNVEVADRLSGVRVLVVEDFAVLGRLLRLALEAQGAVVIEARSGREALALAATQSFDAVLTDLGLPDIPGEAVVVGIRTASRGRTPVAILSGASEEDLTHALDVGAERAFAKPVPLEDLISYLERRAKARPAGRERPRTTETDMTVLIIEDDDAMRALLRDLLVRAGYRAIERPDGADLSALAEHERFDAVILDKEMPGANGLDLLSFLHARLPAVPVIFITAFGGPTVAEEATRRGAYGYLEKPFRVGSILDALATISTHHAGTEPPELH
jgi:DNA-binding response OmpR family regulator